MAIYFLIIFLSVIISVISMIKGSFVGGLAQFILTVLKVVFTLAFFRVNPDISVDNPMNYMFINIFYLDIYAMLSFVFGVMLISVAVHNIYKLLRDMSK